MLYIYFCAISSNRNRDKLIPKILEKVSLQRHCRTENLRRMLKLHENISSKKKVVRTVCKFSAFNKRNLKISSSW